MLENLILFLVWASLARPQILFGGFSSTIKLQYCAISMQTSENGKKPNLGQQFFFVSFTSTSS